MDLQDCINSIVEYAVYDIVNQYDGSYFRDVAYEIDNWSDEDELEDNFNDVKLIEGTLRDIVDNSLEYDVDVYDMYREYADTMCIYADKCNDILRDVGMSAVRDAASEFEIDMNTASECQLAYAVILYNLPSTDIVDDIVDYIVENYDIVKEVKEYME